MSLLRRDLDAGWGVPGVRVRGPVFRLPLPVLLLLWTGGALLRLLVWLLRRPARAGVALVLALLGWATIRYGWVPVTLGLGLLAVAVGAWGQQQPAAFDRLLTVPARSRWRGFVVYRREWQPAMVTAGLTVDTHREALLPDLLDVRSTGLVDVLRARMLPGQTVEDWTRAAPRLAQTFGVPELRVRSVPGDLHGVELRALLGDPLAAVVPLPAPAETVAALTAVPVGRAEDGRPYALPVLYSHLLVAGETGSGKGSVLWSLLLGLGPGIRDGVVRVWAIDPKGGMELSAGAPLFDRFVWGGPSSDGAGWQEPMAVLLEEAVAGMQARAARLRGVTRKLTPTVDEPLIVIVIDEIAALTAYVTDPKLRARIVSALSLLLSQGRAVGVSVVGATQDARKETLAMRDLFPMRVALRCAEPGMVDLILGAGARARGALADHLPETSPGVGYVVVEDRPEPVRVRFAYADDATISGAAATYARGRHAAPASPLDRRA